MKPSEVTQPGYYWVYYHFSKKWTVDEVRLITWYPSSPQLYVMLKAEDCGEYDSVHDALSKYSDNEFEFIGPLEPPSL